MVSLQEVTRELSVVFDAVDVPCQGPLHLSHIADYVEDFCPLSAPDVGPSVLVRGVEHTSFHFWYVAGAASLYKCCA